MKFTKKNTEVSNKPKGAVLADKAKFKKKNESTTNGMIEKGAKLVYQKIKKGALNNKGETVDKTDGNKSNKKADEMNSAQLGLLVDAMLLKKTQKKDSNPQQKKGGNPQQKKVNNPQQNKGVNNTQQKKGGNNPQQKKVNPQQKKGNNQQQKKVNNPQQKKGGNKSQPAVKKQNDLSSSDGSSPQNKKGSKQFNIAQKSDQVGNVSKKQQRNKRKATESVLAMETESSDASPVKESQSKKKKVNTAKTSEKVESEAESKQLVSDENYMLNPNDVLDAVNACITLVKINDSPTKKLLDSEPIPIFIMFHFFTGHPKSRIIRFFLDHSVMLDTQDVCIFVSDTDSKTDDSQSEWKQKLSDSGVKQITEVIPLNTLKNDYTQFNDKRKLASRFDVFLAESKIYGRVFGLVGSKYFHSRRKTPIPVHLEGNLKKNIDYALQTSSAQYKAASQTFTVQIGHTGMKNKEIQENIIRVWEDYPKHFGVYWENIRKAELLVHGKENLPLYCSVIPPVNGPRVFNNLIWTKKFDEPIIGELSTKMDQKVVVFPSGKVVVKKPPKPELSEEEIKAKALNKKQKKIERRKKAKENKKKNKTKQESNTDTDDDLGGREDMLDSASDSDEELEMESEEEEEVKPKGKAVKKNLTNKKQQVKGNKKGQKEEDEEESSDNDSDVERAEEMYLANLAAQKKSNTKTQKDKDEEMVAEDSPGSDDDDDEEDSEGEMDESAFGNMPSDESMDDSDDEEEEEKPKPGKGKKQKQTQPQVQNTKILKGGNRNQNNKKHQKSQNKPGAQKSSSPTQGGKQFNKTKTQQQTNATAKNNKPTNKNSFQGVKADKTKKKFQNNKNQSKNKLISKKMK